MADGRGNPDGSSGGRRPARRRASALASCSAPMNSTPQSSTRRQAIRARRLKLREAFSWRTTSPSSPALRQRSRAPCSLRSRTTQSRVPAGASEGAAESRPDRRVRRRASVRRSHMSFSPRSGSSRFRPSPTSVGARAGDHEGDCPRSALTSRRNFHSNCAKAAWTVAARLQGGVTSPLASQRSCQLCPSFHRKTWPLMRRQSRSIPAISRISSSVSGSSAAALRFAV